MPLLAAPVSFRCGQDGRVDLGILEWVHRRETPAQRRAWELLKKAARFNVPVIPVFHHLLLAERRFRRGPLRLLWTKIYDEPLFRLQCDSVGAGLLLFEEMPKIMGNLRVKLGEPGEAQRRTGLDRGGQRSRERARDWR